MRRLVIAAALAASACSSKRDPLPPPTPSPPSTAPADAATPAAPAAFAPVAPLAGSWEGRHRSARLDWTMAGGAFYGVLLDAPREDGQHFAVYIVDDADRAGAADGRLRLFAFTDGQPDPVRDETELEKDSFRFSAADARAITFGLSTRGLDLYTSVPDGTTARPFTSTPIVRAPELESADLAFAAGVAKRGATGWIAAFEPTGFMLRAGKPVRGEQMRDAMGPLLDAGTLAWAPIASGALGNLGFTVGTAVYTGKTPADNWKSSYVTIWAKQPDGSWKVRFDTGRPISD